MEKERKPDLILERIDEDLKFCERAVASGSRLELAHKILIDLSDKLEYLKSVELDSVDRSRVEKNYHMVKVLLYHVKDRLEVMYKDHEKFLSRRADAGDRS